MTLTITDLDTIKLDDGAHSGPDDGYCLMEAVSMFAKEPFTDSPKCVSPYLRSFGIRLNDRATDERRQDLRQFIPLVVGTAGDGLDGKRRWMGADHAVRVSLPRWLDKAELADHASTLRGLPEITDSAGYSAARLLVNAARDAACTKQREKLCGKTRREYIYAEVQKRLAGKIGQNAVAVAVAVAAAAAAADAAAVAAADAAADADAAAAAAADADAAAAAAAAAVAVADAVAVAAAAAAAVAKWGYGSDNYAKVRKAAYDAARAAYEERYGDLIADSWADAVALYGRLINPVLVSV